MSSCIFLLNGFQLVTGFAAWKMKKKKSKEIDALPSRQIMSQNFCADLSLHVNMKTIIGRAFEISFRSMKRGDAAGITPLYFLSRQLTLVIHSLGD